MNKETIEENFYEFRERAGFDKKDVIEEYYYPKILEDGTLHVMYVMKTIRNDRMYAVEVNPATSQIRANGFVDIVKHVPYVKFI